MTTAKSISHLVSDCIFRTILTEVTERLSLERVSPECVYSVNAHARAYMKESGVCNKTLNELPPIDNSIFLTFYDIIDKFIRRARSDCTAVSRSEEKH